MHLFVSRRRRRRAANNPVDLIGWNISSFLLSTLGLPWTTNAFPVSDKQEVYVDGNKIEIIQFDDSSDNDGNAKISNNHNLYGNYPSNSPFDPINGGDDFLNDDPDAFIIVYIIGSVLVIVLIANMLLMIVKSVTRFISRSRNRSRLSLYGNGMDSEHDQQNGYDVEAGPYDPYAENSVVQSGSNNNNMAIGSNLLIGEKNNSSTNKKKSRNKFEWSVFLDDPVDVANKLALLSPEEQFYYRQGEEYIRQNPPLLVANTNTSNLRSNTDDPNRPNNDRLMNGDINPDYNDGNDLFDPIINEQTRQFIDDEGASAWEFQPDLNLPNDTILVENKTEVIFLNNNYDASVMTNLPIPCINRVYYCEFKIFEWNSNNESDSVESDGEEQTNELISFGLASSPYPYFRLPGRHHNSVAYDSNGGRRANTSFPLDETLASAFPKCVKGDVIGVGYRTRSGTVFFTRNGKKVNEKNIGGHIRGWKFKYLYPCIGANVPCKIHANFGTYGFVYIEANVKKWGYARINGMKLPPPSYEEYGQDTLLESGGEDNDDFDSDDEDDDSEDPRSNRRLLIGSSDNESNIGTFGFIPSQNLGLRDATGKLLPPPPGFEYSTSPHTIHEEISMGYLPSEPPIYSSSTNLRETNDTTNNNNNNNNNIQPSPIRKLINKVTRADNNKYSRLHSQKAFLESSELQDSDHEYDDTLEPDVSINHEGSEEIDYDDYDEEGEEEDRDMGDQDEYNEMENELQRMIEREQDQFSE